jgi:hypothetical protein
MDHFSTVLAKSIVKGEDIKDMRIQSEEEKIAEYIRNQLQEDIMCNQLSFKNI